MFSSDQARSRSELCEHVFEVAETKSLLNVIVARDDKCFFQWIGANGRCGRRKVKMLGDQNLAGSKRGSCSEFGGLVRHELLPSGQTVNANLSYRQLTTVVEKSRCRPFLLHDNAPHHTAKVTEATLDSFGFQVVPHSIFFLKPAPPLWLSSFPLRWDKSWKTSKR